MERFNREHRIRFLFYFIVEQVKLLDRLMDHDPLAFFELGHNLLLPWILLDQAFSVEAFDNVCYFETV